MNVCADPPKRRHYVAEEVDGGVFLTNENAETLASELEERRVWDRKCAAQASRSPTGP